MRQQSSRFRRLRRGMRRMTPSAGRSVGQGVFAQIRPTAFTSSFSPFQVSSPPFNPSSSPGRSTHRTAKPKEKEREEGGARGGGKVPPEVIKGEDAEEGRGKKTPFSQCRRVHLLLGSRERRGRRGGERRRRRNTFASAAAAAARAVQYIYVYTHSCDRQPKRGQEIILAHDLGGGGEEEEGDRRRSVRRRKEGKRGPPPSFRSSSVRSSILRRSQV